MALKHLGSKHFAAKHFLVLSHAESAVVAPPAATRHRRTYPRTGGAGPASWQDEAALDAAIARRDGIQLPAPFELQTIGLPGIFIEKTFLIQPREPADILIVDRYREVLRVAGETPVIYAPPSPFSKGVLVTAATAALAFVVWQSYENRG